MDREGGPQRSEGLRHNAGALVIGHKGAGSCAKAEFGNCGDHIKPCQRFDLINRFDAGVEKEEDNCKADSNCHAGDEILHPSFSGIRTNRRSSDGRFVDANRGFCELLGQINFLQSRKN